MTKPPQEPIPRPQGELVLPPELLTTPEAVNEFINQGVAESPIQAAIDHFDDPDSPERRGVAIIWREGGLGIGYDKRRLVSDMLADPDIGDTSWLDILSNARLPFEGSASLRAFSREKYGPEQVFAHSMKQGFANLTLNKAKVEASRQFLEGVARSPEELASAAEVWISHSLEALKVAKRPTKATDLNQKLLKSIITTAETLAAEPGQTKSKIEIATDALVGLYQGAGDNKTWIASRLQQLLLMNHNDTAIPDADELLREMGKRGVSGRWKLSPEARFEISEGLNGSMERRYTLDGLDAVYEEVVNELPTEILGKKPKRETLTQEAVFVIEDTLMALADTDEYSQNILDAYRRLAGQPRPGRHVAPSLSQFIELSNHVVKLGMPSLSKEDQQELEPLKAGEAAQVPDAFTRLLYVINPKLFSTEYEEGVSLQIPKRVELVEVLMEKALGIEGRAMTVGDFILKRMANGQSASEVAKELRLINAGRPAQAATRHYQRVSSGNDTVKRSVYYNRRKPGYGVIS